MSSCGTAAFYQHSIHRSKVRFAPTLFCGLCGSAGGGISTLGAARSRSPSARREVPQILWARLCTLYRLKKTLYNPFLPRSTNCRSCGRRKKRGFGAAADVSKGTGHPSAATMPMPTRQAVRALFRSGGAPVHRGERPPPSAASEQIGSRYGDIYENGRSRLAKTEKIQQGQEKKLIFNA